MSFKQSWRYIPQAHSPPSLACYNQNVVTECNRNADESANTMASVHPRASTKEKLINASVGSDLCTCRTCRTNPQATCSVAFFQSHRRVSARVRTRSPGTRAAKRLWYHVTSTTCNPAYSARHPRTWPSNNNSAPQFDAQHTCRTCAQWMLLDTKPN
jgi:hypothetical protein